MPGLYLHSPARILSKLLIALNAGAEPNQTTPSLVTWPIYWDNEPDGSGVPANLISVYDTQGIDKGREMVTNERATYEGLQVRVRASDKEQGYAKTQAIAVLLDQIYQRTVSIGTSSYTIQSVMRTSMTPQGREVGQTGRRVWFVNGLITLRMD